MARNNTKYNNKYGKQRKNGADKQGDFKDKEQMTGGKDKRSFSKAKRSRKPRNEGHGDEGKFPQAKLSGSSNDPSWYAVNPELLKSSASFSYNSAIGTPFKLSRIFGSDDAATAANISSTIPGLMSFQTFLTPGVASDAASPVNIAAQNIYSYVRYQNSGGKNYDAPDLMLYLLALDSCYAYWNFLKRVYGMVNAYSQYNRYMPSVFCKACNVDFEDVIANLANFRTYLNNAGAKLSAFCVPAVMSYFVRHSWMFSNIFKDSESFKAQQYIFVPAGFYQYDETSSPSGGKLKFVDYSVKATTPYTTEDLIAKMNAMLNALQYSEDIGVMSGDILKAYGESKLFRLSPVEMDYTVLPVYNEEVLTQIHNLTSISFTEATLEDLTFLDISQDPNTNWIKFDPEFLTSGSVPYESVVVNLPWDDVTPADTMVATRLISTFTTSGEGPKDHFSCLGTEFIGEIYMYNFQTNGVAPDQPATYRDMEITPTKFSTRTYIYEDDTLASLVAKLGAIALSTNFDWHPLEFLQVVDGPASGSTSKYNALCGIIGDVNMYTIIDDAEMSTMTLTAIMSEFGVPQFGPVF